MLQAQPKYSQKPSCDGRADRSVAQQRGIEGFEPARARGVGYIYNPESNPNLLDLPTDLPVGASTPPALWDREADLRNGALDSAYWLALKAAVTSPAAAAPRKYNCSRCGVPKKGHVCPKAATLKRKRETSSAPVAQKMMRVLSY